MGKQTLQVRGTGSEGGVMTLMEGSGQHHRASDKPSLIENLCL